MDSEPLPHATTENETFRLNAAAEKLIKFVTSQWESSRTSVISDYEYNRIDNVAYFKGFCRETIIGWKTHGDRDLITNIYTTDLETLRPHNAQRAFVYSVLVLLERSAYDLQRKLEMDYRDSDVWQKLTACANYISSRDLRNITEERHLFVSDYYTFDIDSAIDLKYHRIMDQLSSQSPYKDYVPSDYDPTDIFGHIADRYTDDAGAYTDVAGAAYYMTRRPEDITSTEITTSPQADRSMDNTTEPQISRVQVQPDIKPDNNNALPIGIGLVAVVVVVAAALTFALSD